MQQAPRKTSARPSKRPRAIAASRSHATPATTLLFLATLIAALAVLALR